jgi:hypothetical protein
MAEAQRRAMEIEKRELEAIVKRRCTILDIITIFKKILKFHIVSDSCGHRQNITMINMLNKWRIGRILKKIGLLK